MNVYALITPIVVALLLFEIIYSIRVKNGIYSFQDTITNLGTGIGNQCINLGRLPCVSDAGVSARVHP